jgi:hypothetical protein
VNPSRTSIALCVVLAPAWVACSLQDFDYLTRGTGVSASEGGVDSSVDVATQEAAPQDEASAASDSGGSDVSQPESDGGIDATSVVDARAEAGGPTNYIVNGNFDDGTLNGWTVAPIAAEYTDVKTQIAADFGNTPPQGQIYELASYAADGGFTVDLSQTPTDLPNGVYTFAGWFSRGTNDAVYIYVQGCGDAGTMTSNVPITAGTQWVQVVLGGIQVTGGGCQFGLHIQSEVTQWVNADGFTLEVQTTDAGDAAAAGDN